MEDGTFFHGRSFGVEGVRGGELVFNTGMTGYQEILTDPSYAGQIVLMTYPLIGNYGVNPMDVESGQIAATGFVVREYTENFSNFRGTKSLSSYLAESNVVALEGIDTRALTRRIRSLGAPRALIAAGNISKEELSRRLQDVPPMTGRDLVSHVACRETYSWSQGSRDSSRVNIRGHVVVVDCGVKHNILRMLVDEGMKVTVVPPTLTAEQIRALNPGGLLISNGPGDPQAVQGLPKTLRNLMGSFPMLGICLGHQLLALALGARTRKLKFGHHGVNHPVRNEETGRVEITSQNHGFTVDPDSLDRLDGKDFGPVRISHLHLSDGTVEGFMLPDVHIQAIQYHPEANPGPHDASYVFSEFVACIEKHWNG